MTIIKAEWPYSIILKDNEIIMIPVEEKTDVRKWSDRQERRAELQ